MDPNLSVFSLTEGSTTVVTAQGDIDLRTHGRLAAEALPLAATARRFVLDLSDVGFMDSSGIGSIIRIRQSLASRKMSLHVVASRRVLAALKLSAVASTVVLHDSVGQALADRS